MAERIRPSTPATSGTTPSTQASSSGASGSEVTLPPTVFAPVTSAQLLTLPSPLSLLVGNTNALQATRSPNVIRHIGSTPPGTPRLALPATITCHALGIDASVPPDLTAWLTDTLHNAIAHALSSPDAWIDPVHKRSDSSHTLTFHFYGDSTLGSRQSVAVSVKDEPTQGQSVVGVRLIDLQGRVARAPVRSLPQWPSPLPVYVPILLLDHDPRMGHALLSATWQHLTIGHPSPDGTVTTSFAAASTHESDAPDFKVDLELQPALDGSLFFAKGRLQSVFDLNLPLQFGGEASQKLRSSLGLSSDVQQNFVRSLLATRALGKNSADIALFWTSDGKPRYEYKPSWNQLHICATFTPRHDGWVYDRIEKQVATGPVWSTSIVDLAS